MKWLSVIVAALALAACATIQPGTPTSLSAAERAAVEEGTKRHLRDPMSAVFGDMLASRLPDGSTFVCGMVNAKNAFGGYVGARPFAGVLHPGGRFEFRTVARSDGDVLGLRYACRQAGAPLLG